MKFVGHQPSNLAPMQSLARRPPRQTIEIGIWIPLALFLVAGPAVFFASNIAFGIVSCVSAILSIRVTYVLLLTSRELRVTWLMGDAFLLGYGLGTFNTVLQLTFQGLNTAQHFSRPQQELSNALATALLASAVLFLAGLLLEQPIPIDFQSSKPVDLRVIWLILSIVFFAYFRGDLGYMGVQHSEDFHASIIGELAVLLAPILPGLTIRAKAPRSIASRTVLAFTLAIEVAVLVPDGRRELLYALAVAAFAFCLRGGNLKISPAKAVALLCAIVCFWTGNTLFYSLRHVVDQAGKHQESNAELARDTLSFFLHGRDSAFDEAISENLRDRTLILTYLSDLLAASSDHQPLYGEDALYSFKMAVPSLIYANKDAIRDIDMEEYVVNPQFGLPLEDDPNSILTSGLGDFGIFGLFIYPVVMALLVSVCLRVLVRRRKIALKLTGILAITYAALQAETATSSYFVLCRNVAIIFVAAAVLQKASEVLRAKRHGTALSSHPKRSFERRLQTLIAWEEGRQN